jgi:hypothetical protein
MTKRQRDALRFKRSPGGPQAQWLFPARAYIKGGPSDASAKWGAAATARDPSAGAPAARLEIR